MQGEMAPLALVTYERNTEIFVNVYLLEPLLLAPRSLGLPSFGSIVVLLEGGVEVPLPTEPAPELLLPELPEVELPLAEPPLRGLP